MVRVKTVDELILEELELVTELTASGNKSGAVIQAMSRARELGASFAEALKALRLGRELRDERIQEGL